MRPHADAHAIPFSLLDLAPICRGATATEALRNTRDLAQHAERWGYHRYWLAEHHSIPGVASAATAVVIGYVADATTRIRVGAGGIMLPNHAPLVIAEQFGTLAALHPERIDLGLGRAPGADQRTARALRRNLGSSGDTFPDDVRELMSYFRGGGAVRAIPGEGQAVPIYLLGSSDFSARLAAELGLPFAFASHFAPDQLDAALTIYRRSFRPSPSLAQPYVIVGVSVFAADRDEEARRLFSSMQQMFLALIRGAPGEVPPPVDAIDELWSPEEARYVGRATRFSAVGAPPAIRRGLEAILDATQADEIITTAQIFDHRARLRSFELTAGVFGEINRARGVRS
ncbi:MAG: alkane 1-monooxygenase [bacterium]|nr:alkane 1-monooxygenase [bacterium]